MYVVFNIFTTMILQSDKRSMYNQSYKTLGAARGALTRAANAGDLGRWDQEDFGILEAGEFRDTVEHQVPVRNLMSGKTVYERINLPYTLSVSSETYWSA